MGESVHEGRLLTPDVAKGIVIVIILMCHIFASNEGSGTAVLPLIMQEGFIGLMCFFIISGYFFRPGRSYGANVGKRSILLGLALLLCFLVLTTAMWIVLIVAGQDPGAGDYVDALARIFGSENVLKPYGLATYFPVTGISIGYYFLQVMLVAFFIFYAVANYVLDDMRKFAVTVALLLLTTALLREFVDMELPLFAQLAPLASALMLFGALLGRHNVLAWMEGKGWKERKYWLFVAIGITVFTIMGILFPPGVDFFLTYFGEYGGWSVFPYYINAIAFGYTFLALCSFICKVRFIGKLFAVIGSHTLAILLIHGFIVKVFAIIFGYTLSPEYWFPEMTVIQRSFLLVFCVVAGTLAGIAGSKFIAEVLFRKKQVSGN